MSPASPRSRIPTPTASRAASRPARPGRGPECGSGTEPAPDSSSVNAAFPAFVAMVVKFVNVSARSGSTTRKPIRSRAAARPLPEAGRRRPWLSAPALRARALALLAGAVLLGSQGAAEAQTQTVSISISSSRIDEGGSATLTVNANPAFGSDQTVALTWDGAPLVNGVIQGTGNTTSFTLTGGNTSQTFALTAPEDNVYVPEKEADLVAEIDGQHYSTKLRYVDNEGKPTVTIRLTADRVDEDETADLRVVAELSHASAETHKVGLTVLDPYDALTGTVPAEFEFTACTFGPNCPQTTDSHMLTLDDNTLEDGTRPVDFALTVGDAAHATLGMRSTVRLWVKDDDAPPSKPQNVVAAGGVEKVRLSWDEPEYTSGDRITKYQYRQSINDGVTWHLGWVDVLDGATVRELEITGLPGGIEHTFQVRAFSDNTGRGDFSEVRATPFSLETVEGLGWNLFFSSSTIVEGGAGVTATISIDGDPLPGPVSLPIQVNELVDDNGVQQSRLLEGLDDGGLIDAVEGDDVVGVTFPAGARSMTLTLFVPVDDTLYTPPTLLEIAVLSPRTVMPGAMVASELSWRDNDPVPVATLAVDRTTVTEGEDVTLTATLATGFAAALTEVPVDVEVDGVPPTSASTAGPFEFAAGETTATLEFATTEELTHSGGRTVTIFLKPPLGAAYALADPSSVTVQVLDKLVPVVTVMADRTVMEGETITLTEGEGITLTAVLSFGFDSMIEVDVDADDPYGALDGSPGTFSFAAGDTTATIDVQTVDEMEHAGSGTVTLTLAEPTGGTYLLGDDTTVSLRVLDDDASPTAPRNLRAEARVDGVWLTWDAPDSSGDGMIDEYQFRVSRDGGRTWETKDPQWHFAGDADTRSREVEFKEYRELTFQLAAQNDVGYGPWSSSATVTPVQAGSLKWRFRASSNTARRNDSTYGGAAVLIEGNTITGTLTIVEGGPFMKDQSIPVSHAHPAGPHLIRAADGSEEMTITLPAGHMSAGIELHVPDDELYWTPAHGRAADRTGNTTCSGCVPRARRLQADVPGSDDPEDYVVVLEDEGPPVINMSATAAQTVISEADMASDTDQSDKDLKFTVTLSHGYAEPTTIRYDRSGGGGRRYGTPDDLGLVWEYEGRAVIPADTTEVEVGWPLTDDSGANTNESDHLFSIGLSEELVHRVSSDAGHYYLLGPNDKVSYLFVDNDSAPTAPTGVVAEALDQAVRLRWQEPDYGTAGGGHVGWYQYRLKAGTGSYGSWQDIPGYFLTRTHTVTHTTEGGSTRLTNGTLYTIDLRAKNAHADDGAAATAVTATPSATATEVTYELSLSSSTITEGGTVTATLTGSSALTTARKFQLEWGGVSLADDRFVQGSSMAHEITIAANQTSGTLRLNAPDNRFDLFDEREYRHPETRDLVAKYFRESVASVPLSFVDDEEKPTVSIGAAQDTVTEGELLELTLRLEPAAPFAGREDFTEFLYPTTPIRVEAKNLATNAKEVFEVLFYPSIIYDYYPYYRRGDTVKRVQYRVPDTMDGSRQLTFTVVESPTDSYQDGASVMVTVGDNDTPPGAPQNLSAAVGDARVTLSWDPPLDDGGLPVRKYQYFWTENVDGGAGSMDWIDVPDGADAGADAGDETRRRIEGLVNGSEHTFRVRAVTAAGAGSEAETMATPLAALADPALAAEWSLTLSSDTLTEGGGAGAIATLRITNAVVFDSDVTVGLELDGEVVGGAVQPGARVEGADGANSFTIPAGKSSRRLALRAVDDTVYQGGGTENYSLRAVLDTVLLAQADLAVVDDDALPEVTIAAGETVVTEEETITLTATLSTALTTDIDVSFHISSTDQDVLYDDSGRKFHFPAGTTTASESVSTAPSSATVNAEAVFTLQESPGSYTLGDPFTVRVLVRDDDSTPGEPQSLRAAGSGTNAIDVAWDALLLSATHVSHYEVRYVSAGSTQGSWGNLTDSGPGEANRTGFTFSGSSISGSYDIDVRACSGTNCGTAASVTASTGAPAYSFTLTPSTTGSDNNPVAVLEKGGSAVTVTVAVPASVTLLHDRTVTLAWTFSEDADEQALRNGLIEGEDGATTFVIPAGAGTSGRLAIRAPDEGAYWPEETATLTATVHGEEIGTATLTRRDDEGRLVARFDSATGQVREGHGFGVVAYLVPPYGPGDLTVTVVTTDEDSVLPPGSSSILEGLTFDRTATSMIPGLGFGSTYFTGIVAPDNSTLDAVRSWSYRMEANADLPYEVGTPSSLTVALLDDDKLPGIPTNLRAVPGVDRVTLSWNVGRIWVDRWDVEYRFSGPSPVVWEAPAEHQGQGHQPQHDGSDGTLRISPAKTKTAGRRVSYVVEDLLPGTAYDFRVGGYNTDLFTINDPRDSFTEIYESVSATTLDDVSEMDPVGWEFTVTANGSVNDDGDPRVVEGGADVTVQATITSGFRFAEDQQVALFWGDEEVGGLQFPGSALEGTGGVHALTIRAGQARSNALQVRARQDSLYLYPMAAELEGRHDGTRIGGATVSYLDDDPVPQVSIAAAPTVVREGEAFDVTVTSDQAALHGVQVVLSITDDDASLDFSGTVTSTTPYIDIPPGRPSGTRRYATVDDTTAATRTVTFTVEPDDTTDRYDVVAGSATTTVMVLDDDAMPAVPAGIAAAPGGDRVALSWDPPAAVAVDRYEVRHRTAGSDAPAWTNVDWENADVATNAEGRLETVVRGLVPATHYEFQVRGVNAAGNGNAAAISTTTVAVEWSFTVTSGHTFGRGSLPAVREGDNDNALTVTVEITNNVTFDDRLEVELLWDREAENMARAEEETLLSDPGSVLEGVAGVHVVTIDAGESSGSVEIRARQDALFFDHGPQVMLGRYLGTEIGSARFYYQDDESRPQVSISAPPSVTEGDTFDVTVETTQAMRFAAAVAWDITDAGSLLDGTPGAGTATIGAGETAATFGYTTLGDTTTAAAARSVAFTLKSTDAPFEVYFLSSDTTATVAVLDDDALPAAPVDLQGFGANTEITLSWAPPPIQAVTGYEYRYRITGTPESAWSPDWGALTLDGEPREGGRVGFTVESLTLGASYDFEVRGVNGIGKGAEAGVTVSTIVIEWTFEVSPSSTDTEGNTKAELVEGGAAITATARITNNPDRPSVLEIPLTWCGEPLGGDGALVSGENGASKITIDPSALTGSLTISAPPDAADAEAVYYPPTECDLVASFGGESPSVALTRTDAAATEPVVTLGEVPAQAAEGETLQVEAFLAPQYGPGELPVTVAVADPESAMSSVPETFVFPARTGTVSAAFVVGTNTTADDARSVTIELEEDPDQPYSVGTPFSATVAVLDDDAVPAAPAPLTGVGSNDTIALTWTPPPVQVVTSYEYRYRLATTGTTTWGPSTVPADDGWEAVPDSAAGGANRTSFTVTGLTVGASYDFEVRGVNGIGKGAAASTTTSTIVIEWEFSVSGATGPAEAKAVTLREGGTRTATARITNAAGNADLPLADPITIPLTWCGAPLGDNPLVTGENGAKGITIAANSLNATLTIEAPADAAGAAVYHPRTECPLVAEFAGEAYSVALARTDAQSVPVATIRAEPEALAEGESIDVTVTLAPPFGGGDGGVVLLAVEDADSALAVAATTALTFGDGIGERTFTVATAANGIGDSQARAVVFALRENPDFPHYGVGTPASATVRVLDQDAAPAAPVPLSGRGQEDGTITLTWTPPPAQAVTHYEYRYGLATGTTTWGSWTQVADSGPGGANRTSVTVGSLTVGQTYAFQVRGENAAGKGAEADVTVSTVELEWSFSVSSEEVREGGAPLTVQARITNDKTAPIELEVELFWGGNPGTPIGGSLYPGAALEGADDDGVHVITIAQGASSGVLQVRGRDDLLYFPRHSHELEGRVFGAKIGARTVIYLDDEPVPVLSIGPDADRLRRSGGALCETGIEGSYLATPEGEGGLACVMVTQGSVEKLDYDVVAAPAGLIGLEEYRPSLLERGDTYRAVYFRIFDDGFTMQDAPRRATLTLVADDSGIDRFDLDGAASSVSVWALDSDAVPLQPKRLRVVSSGEDRVTLTWNPPTQVEVDTYLLQYREAGTPESDWSPRHYGHIPTTDDDEFGVTVDGLTPGTDYEFELWARNTRGDSPKATQRARTAGVAPALSVADTEVDEGPGATAEFAVTLAPAARAEVTVDYTTEDGTATAGNDYTAASGTLTFAPGETEKTVSVTVLDDVVNDEGETFKLVLSSPSGARLGDAEGIAVIHNSDPIPAAWLARFGRTVADHVVEALGERFEGPPGAGSHVTLGGQRIGLDGGAGSQGAASERSGSEAAARDGLAAGERSGSEAAARDGLAAGERSGSEAAVGDGLAAGERSGSEAAVGDGLAAGERSGSEAAARDGLAAGESSGSEAAARDRLAAFAERIGSGAGGGAWPRREESGFGAGWMHDRGDGATREMTGRELLLGSSFHLSLANDEEGAGAAAARWTAWGRASSSRFDGEADGLVIDGDVTTFTLGADAARGGWLAGVAVSLSEGDGGFRDHADSDHPGQGSGTLESTLNVVHPYLRYEASERLSVWGTLGYGTGELTLAVDGAERWTTGTAMEMAAAGARGVLVPAPQAGGFELAARTDAQLVRMTSQAAIGSGDGTLAETRGDTSRLRLMLEGSRAFALGSGGALTPSFEVGLRHDAGDAETGTGIEIGGGVRYTDPATGLSVDAKVRGLVAHEDASYSEWGASGSVRIEPDASGRGLSLTLTPVWGAPEGGAQRLWSVQDARGLAANERVEPESRLEAELGYGFSVLDGRGVATPHAGWTRDGESEALRLGQRLTLGASQWGLEGEFGEAHRTLRAGYGYRLGDFLDFGVEAGRREAANDGDTEHGMMLRARIRW